MHCGDAFKSVERASGSRPKAFKDHLISIPGGAFALLLCPHRPGQQRQAENVARECGKTLLVLDAVTGGDAARLYERMGWVRVGDIPDYALLASPLEPVDG